MTNDARRADDGLYAANYRWLRDQHWSNSDMCVVMKPKENVRLGSSCPSGKLLDDAIIEARLKEQEERHDGYD